MRVLSRPLSTLSELDLGLVLDCTGDDCRLKVENVAYLCSWVAESMISLCKGVVDTSPSEFGTKGRTIVVGIFFLPFLPLPCN